MKNKETKLTDKSLDVDPIGILMQSTLMRCLFNISMSRASQGRSDETFSEDEIVRLKNVPGVITTSDKKDNGE